MNFLDHIRNCSRCRAGRECPKMDALIAGADAKVLYDALFVGEDLTPASLKNRRQRIWRERAAVAAE